MHLIKTQGYSIDQIEYSEVNGDEMRSFEIDNVPLIPLLWQTGYLTIEDYNPISQLLHKPHHECKISFLANYVFNLTQSLRHENLKIFFANIPCTMQLSLEKIYQSIFYVITTLIGDQTQAEIATNQGRIDATIETDTIIYIFEFKIDGSADEALNQIKSKKYYEKYLNSEKKIFLIGVNFDTKIRNIEKWSLDKYT